MGRLRRATQRLVSNGRQEAAVIKPWPSLVHQGTPELDTIAMASPTSSQGTQDASVPEELALDRGALRLLFCTKQQAAALLAVQQGVQGRLGAPRCRCSVGGVRRRQADSCLPLLSFCRAP